MPIYKDFHLGDILTLVTGKMVYLHGLDKVLELLRYITGENLMHHQIPRAAPPCGKWILAQHPFLGVIDTSTIKSKGKQWLYDLIKQYGETLPIKPMEHWNPKDPLEELVEMRRGKKVIVIEHEKPVSLEWEPDFEEMP